MRADTYGEGKHTLRLLTVPTCSEGLLSAGDGRPNAARIPAATVHARRTTADSLKVAKQTGRICSQAMANADWTSATLSRRNIKVPVSVVTGELRDDVCSPGHIPVSLLADDPTLHRENAIPEHGRMENAMILDLD